jgi:hypothetical protein
MSCIDGDEGLVLFPGLHDDLGSPPIPEWNDGHDHIPPRGETVTLSEATKEGPSESRDSVQRARWSQLSSRYPGMLSRKREGRSREDGHAAQIVNSHPIGRLPPRARFEGRRLGIDP